MNKIIENIKKRVQNPYPEWMFPMTTKDFVEAVPDPKLRTAISGCVGRYVFDFTVSMMLEYMEEELEDLDEKENE